MTTLVQEHDCLLLDLDGTVFRGHEPTAGAVDTLAAVASRTLYVTNNASRSADEVAAASARDGLRRRARRRRHQCPERRASAGRPVTRREHGLIVGTESLAAEIEDVGLKPVRQCRTSPSPSFRGIHPRPAGPIWPRRRWPSAAARCGSPPTSTRRCPPNGVCCPETARWSPRCSTATDREPRSQESRQPTLLTDALSRGDFRTPLVVGDRLDTDIAGANAAGLPSLMVLSGVSTASEAVRAVIGERPNYIGYPVHPRTRSPEYLEDVEQVLHGPVAGAQSAPPGPSCPSP